MPRSAIWKNIAESLVAELAQGHYPPGTKLPTEAALSARFGVNRHTVRHALADLASRGLVVARRGAGVFVASRPTDYPIGRRVRFTQAVATSGRTPSRTLTRLETRPSDVAEAEALAIAPATAVHVVEGLSFADGEPLAVFRAVFPAYRFPKLLASVQRNPSLTAAMAADGVEDYTRASTRLTAKIARGTLALALRLPEGAPILRSVAVNVDANGVPIEFGTTWFAGDRITLTIQPD